MKISEAFRKAGRVYFGHFGSAAGFLVIELCLTLMCLAPALFLMDGKLTVWTAAVIPMWLLIMLPARMNAAEAMKDALNGGSLYSGRLADPARYGSKLLSGLKRLFFLLIWSVPLLFCAYQAKTHIAGETDVITLLEIIRDNFGGGNTVQGVFYIVLIAVATLLVLAAGCAFHSGARHARAQGDPKLVNGHHGKIMLTWLCALVTLLPLIAALGILVLRYAPALGNPEELISGSAHLPSTRISAVILAAGAVLTVPLLPLRSLISAAFVDGLKGKDA